jgi:hypothetical protein
MTLELLKMWNLTGQIAPWGMPTYQLGANYPYDYIADDVLRFYHAQLIIYFILFGFIIGFKNRSVKGIFCALAFGFSTYLIIIIGVGHNAKAHVNAIYANVICWISSF